LKRPSLAVLGPSLILALVAFGIDRLHKLVQLDLLGWTGGEFVPVTGFFDYVLVWNTGISYGLLGDVPFWVLALLVAAALIGLMVWWYRADSGLLRAGLALAIGGALSNAVDRWRYGAVADFFHFHWQNWSFYIFNLADAAISVGVLLLILDFVGIGRGKRSERIAA
jgi:signal peptidase II